MKKLIALSVVLSFLGVSAFAEIKVTGQFDAVLIPLQVITQDNATDDEEDVAFGAGIGRNGNSAAPRARIGVTASDPDGKIGLNFKLQFNAAVSSTDTSFRVAFDDFAEVWAKPVDWFRVDVGRFVDDRLRGKIGDDGWQHYTTRMKDADAIFTRFKWQWGSEVGGIDKGGGFLISLTPIEGLFIGAGVPGLLSFNASNSTHADETLEKAGYAYQRIQAGVGYEIGGIGLVRVQYVGAKPSVNGSTIIAPKIEAAFAYTGMEGLVIDLGAKIPLPFSEWTDKTGFWIKEPTEDHPIDMGTAANPDVRSFHKDVTYWNPIQVSLGAGFTTGAIGINARIDTKFAGSVKDKDDNWKTNLPFELNFHLWPSYNLGFATVGVDFGLEFIGKTTDQDDKVINESPTSDGDNGGIRVGFGAWLKKSFGSSSIKGGLAYRVGTEVNSSKENGAFTIPIIFDYSF